jgi:hypothetical protein
VSASTVPDELPGNRLVQLQVFALGVAVAGGGGGERTRDWDFAEVAFRALGPGFTHSDVMHQDKPVYVEP